jgi:3-dehydroquinate synthetase
VKHGLISDPSLFQRLEARPELRPSAADLGNIIASAIQVKINIVEEDPFEQGRRRVLNLGHTFAHAFEVLDNFELRHGHAVGLGMIVAARVASQMGICSPELPGRIQALLQEFGLPTQLPSLQPETVWEVMMLDKKKRGSQLRFILPRTLGDVIITEDVSRETVLSVLGGSNL